jgi:hypothetical protein
MQKLQIVVVSIALIVLCTGFSFFNSKHTLKEETIEYSHKLLPEGTLEVKNITGAITIEGWDKETISVKAQKKAPEKEFDTLKIDTKFTDTSAFIETLTEKTGWRSFLSWGTSNRSVDYTIKVPYKTFLYLAETVSGTINVRDLKDLPQVGRFQTMLKVTNGDIRCANIGNMLTIESTRGDVSVTNLGASLSIDVTNGNVQIFEPQGALTIKTVRGDVKVMGARHSSIIATTNGTITLHQLALSKNEKIDLQTTRGDIVLCLAKSIGAAFTAKTTRKATEFLFIEKLTSKKVQGFVGNKDVEQSTITLAATNGDFKISFEDC